MRETTLLVASIVVVLTLAPAAALGGLAPPALDASSLGSGLGSGSGASEPVPDGPLEDAQADVATEGVEPDAPEADLLSVLEGEEYVVGYAGELPYALFEALGAEVVDHDDVLRFAVVRTHAPDLLRALDGAAFAYAVPNGETKAASTSWDASRWDASRWDASRWDAATWDASRWDAASWDASRWDAARWDAATWDASRWDASRWDAATWNGSAWMDPGFGVQWSLGAMHIPDAWQYVTGDHRRTLCVIDTGVDAAHPDLTRNVLRLRDGSFGYDFVNNDNNASDDADHGTHIAGIAAAETGNGQGISGIAKARIIAAKVLDASGTGTEANLAKGIRYCADRGANVGVLALHTDQDNPAVYDAVKYAKSKDLLLVAASGNDGRVCETCVGWPARYAEVLGVGATDVNASPAIFSNGGKDLYVVAPGVAVAGPVRGGYAFGSGTSQAAANVAGGVLLLWSAKPTMTWYDVMKMLGEGARDDGSKGQDWWYGLGHARADLMAKKMGYTL